MARPNPALRVIEDDLEQAKYELTKARDLHFRAEAAEEAAKGKVTLLESQLNRLRPIVSKAKKKKPQPNLPNAST